MKRFTSIPFIMSVLFVTAVGSGSMLQAHAAPFGIVATAQDTAQDSAEDSAAPSVSGSCSVLIRK